MADFHRDDATAVNLNRRGALQFDPVERQYRCVRMAVFRCQIDGNRTSEMLKQWRILQPRGNSVDGDNPGRMGRERIPEIKDCRVARFEFADVVPENADLRPVFVEFADYTKIVEIKDKKETLDITYPLDLEDYAKSLMRKK